MLVSPPTESLESPPEILGGVCGGGGGLPGGLARPGEAWHGLVRPGTAWGGPWGDTLGASV